MKIYVRTFLMILLAVCTCAPAWGATDTERCREAGAVAATLSGHTGDKLVSQRKNWS